ncbi:MAG: hypothetical protein WCO86_07850 [Planctomycetota bacterium]
MSQILPIRDDEEPLATTKSHVEQAKTYKNVHQTEINVAMALAYVIFGLR